MEDLRSLQHDPFDTPSNHPTRRDEREEWEDWEDDEPDTAATSMEEPLVDVDSAAHRNSKDRVRRSDARLSQARKSALRIARLKSRKRQKAQNAKAGITLVTDMTKFQRQQHIAQQLRSAGSKDERTGKFVDAAALRALEGDPSSATVGSWAWLKKKPAKMGHKRKGSQKSVQSSAQQDLSPNDRPIVIGISLPQDDLADKVISPQTAVVGTPVDFTKQLPKETTQKIPPIPSSSSPQQFKSVWSPDTEDGFSPSRFSRAASSMYSQNSTFTSLDSAPPVPAVPFYFKEHVAQPVKGADDDDSFTPVTEFEEDGSPVYSRKSPKSAVSRMSRISPETTKSRSGWWDHVKTPFSERGSPFSAHARSEKGDSPAVDEWWIGKDEKKARGPFHESGNGESSSSRRAHVPAPLSVPIIREPTPTIASSSRSSPQIPEPRQQSHSDKARILAEEEANTAEEPPPYSPPSKQNMVRYRAVFPPGHALASQFPPSPGPMTPGLAGTMTSQGSISMTEVPLTPSSRATPLPDRPVGAYVTGEHFAQVIGKSPAAKTERRRRRHEKEEYIARKIGSFWKGRGCIPENGCYGRSGREGRKRRRICLGIFGGVIAAVILIVVLAVTLAHKHHSSTPVDTRWLNLTDFPPMPTGISTVVGPENPVTVTGCTQPLTLWTCSLPKEQQSANEPYNANQPKFIMQIQYDNSTKQLWNVKDPEPPHPTGTSQDTLENGADRANQTANANKGNGTDGSLSTRDVQVFDEGFVPNPLPPSFDEMWFLGNTTDGVVSDRKAGEPTPFFISFFESLNETAGPNMLPETLTRRGDDNSLHARDAANLTTALPPPDLNPDGTGAPAKLLAYPFQQPLRLFDRGLPTEHYGFYSYFNKTLYVKSVTPLNKDTTDEGNVPADEDGGCLETEANFLITWTQTRFHVQIWTRMDNSSTSLLQGAPDNNTRPGTMPYSMTVSVDTHGGDYSKKASFYYGVDDRQHINRTDTKLISNDVGFDSPRINPGFQANPSWGGIDGGTGGCRCSWVNFVNENGNTIGGG